MEFLFQNDFINCKRAGFILYRLDPDAALAMVTLEILAEFVLVARVGVFLLRAMSLMEASVLLESLLLVALVVVEGSVLVFGREDDWGKLPLGFLKRELNISMINSCYDFINSLT